VNVRPANQITVVDRKKREVTATWPLKDAKDNYTMALDEADHRLFVGCRQPAKIIIYNTESGKTVGGLDIPGDVDDLFYDARDKRLMPALDLTLVGDPGQGQVREILKEMYRHYLPERRLVLKNPNNAVSLEKAVPAVRDYDLKGGAPAAYVCRSFACLPPISDPQELAAKLRRLASQKAGP
jgi:hypothetical protein